eukprot:5661112-Amphidinium_carterae.1
MQSSCTVPVKGGTARAIGAITSDEQAFAGCCHLHAGAASMAPLQKALAAVILVVLRQLNCRVDNSCRGRTHSLQLV